MSRGGEMEKPHLIRHLPGCILSDDFPNSKNYKMKIYFSDFFSIPPDSIERYGAFNISLLSALPLFIDPFLLFNSKNPEYHDLHDRIVTYLRFLKDKSSNQ